MPDAPPGKPDFGKLVEGKDGEWMRAPGWNHLACLKNVEFYVPRRGQTRKSVVDVWFRFVPVHGQKITQAALGFVADLLPYPVEGYRPTGDETPGEEVAFARDEFFWYPTVVMNMDVKKALPEEGVEWLQMRVLAKGIKNGRMDLEVVVFDEGGELVMVSGHVNLIVGVERNLGGRKREGSHI